MNHNDEKILIEIAAFKEVELINTVNSALIQADYPERVSFAICYQNDDLSDYNILKNIKNCKIKLVKEKDAKGSCYARYLCQQMIENEEYIYQIDSHMRFVKHWDTKMIELLSKTNDKNAIISFYPVYCTEDLMKLSLDDPYFENPAPGGIMRANTFRGETSFIELVCDVWPKEEKILFKKSAFIAGGNFFTYAKIHKQVLNDPEMLFYGDELPMSIRLFTYGYNIYNTNVSYIYHQYERPNRFFPTVPNGMTNEEKRFLNLIKLRNDGIDLKEFGLGDKRTIDEYMNFSGIDFKNRIIYLNAETGDLDNPDYKGKISYFMKKDHDNDLFIKKQRVINVLIVDIFGDYKACIESCLANSEYKNKIQFIIGSVSLNIPNEEERNKYQIKKFIHQKNPSYSKIVNELSSHLDNGYTLIIDSSVRFFTKWDEYLCENIKKCGRNSVLTSWVWKKDGNEEFNNMYQNIVREYYKFENYLPVLNYRTVKNNYEFPYLSGYVADGLLFGNSKIFKKIPYDPNLDYEEQKYIYALRLWTNGINIYYPESSYFIRVREESLLSENKHNYDIVCALSGIKNIYSRTFDSNYLYDIGQERSIYSWYQFLNIEYDSNKKQLLNEDVYDKIGD